VFEEPLFDTFTNKPGFLFGEAKFFEGVLVGEFVTTPFCPSRSEMTTLVAGCGGNSDVGCGDKEVEEDDENLSDNCFMPCLGEWVSLEGDFGIGGGGGLFFLPLFVLEGTTVSLGNRGGTGGLVTEEGQIVLSVAEFVF